MNSFTEKDRIEQFSEKLMNSYVPEDFKKWLIENGFFTAPASIHHHGVYLGALFGFFCRNKSPSFLHRTT